MTRVTSIGLDELRVGPTAALFEGGPRAGAGITMFVVRTPPRSFVELHTHPYPETFVLLAGSGRWTAGGLALEVRRADHFGARRHSARFSQHGGGAVAGGVSA
jgi:quercetin dioxygenase-like cupin family protein